MVLRTQCGIQIGKKGVLSHKTVEIGSSLLIHSFRNVFKEFLFDLLQECSDLKEIHLKSQNGGKLCSSSTSCEQVRKTLPKALRTQALTALTSNFVLAHYAW